MHADTTARPGIDAGLRRVLIVLCTTEIISWGVLYYAFPVLLPTISASTGWSLAAITAGFSASQVVAGLVGIPVGRLLDRHGPRAIMTTGSIVAVLALAALATADSLVWFTAAWLLAGVAMAGIFYAPAFAALTRWYGPRRVSALTALTLVAGLASTVFAPLTAVLNERLDWRGTYLVLAGFLAVTTIPLHLWGLRLPWPAVEHETAHAPSAVARSRPFLVLVVAMSLAAFSVYAVVINLVPLLTERGMTTSAAAVALGLGGVGQVLGRLGYARLAARTSVRTRTVLILLVSAVVTALLGVVPGPALLLIAGSVLAGVTRGIFTLVQATAITDRWGAVHYGQLNGLLTAPVMLTAAIAPWAGSAMAAWLGGYPAVFVVLGVIGVLAAGLSTASVPR
ncbi:MFS transporter [Lentzea flaviverrucosa]|uniref:Predicted arabinose efflux permease, MFS family n=1 Tax=Lentzea flaviverrucosa TaxID=200379 RepID=A0A1H9XEN9_9PSEU|nr:MFS transporter [Lentzea flaviverrucosa]RDI21478.1 putative MFS family arabinose efflux permease [Lentzea flaviverrucosa]SES44656.1 Predicted arabinose efflux permease, MFS family [Lentzea flaviverrucosa]